MARRNPSSASRGWLQVVAMTKPIQRAAKYLRKRWGSNVLLANDQIAELVFESISVDGLAQAVKAHRRNRAIRFGAAYACLCGEELRSNSHHAQSEHIARAVKEYLAGEGRND